VLIVSTAIKVPTEREEKEESKPKEGRSFNDCNGKALGLEHRGRDQNKCIK
jgi:hypothetical protein